jgi:hypothetical protein
MNQVCFVLFFIAGSAFSQGTANSDYVVLTDNPRSFFQNAAPRGLQIDKTHPLKDISRAERNYNAYFSRAADLRQRFFNCYYAYEPDAFTLVTNSIQHSIFPEVKW